MGVGQCFSTPENAYLTPVTPLSLMMDFPFLSFFFVPDLIAHKSLYPPPLAPHLELTPKSKKHRILSISWRRSKVLNKTMEDQRQWAMEDWTRQILPPKQGGNYPFTCSWDLPHVDLTASPTVKKPQKYSTNTTAGISVSPQVY